MDCSKLIKIVISTLDDVEVKGRDNLDKLLGCINALESVAKRLDSENAKPAERTEEVQDG